MCSGGGGGGERVEEDKLNVRDTEDGEETLCHTCLKWCMRPLLGEVNNGVGWSCCSVPGPGLGRLVAPFSGGGNWPIRPNGLISGWSSTYRVCAVVVYGAVHVLGVGV